MSFGSLPLINLPPDACGLLATFLLSLFSLIRLQATFLTSLFPCPLYTSYFILCFLLVSVSVISLLPAFLDFPSISLFSLSSYSCCLPSSLSFMASSSASGQRGSGLPSSPVRFPPPYAVEQHNAKKGSCHDFRRFLALPNYPGHCPIFQNNDARDTAAALGVRGESIEEGRASLITIRPGRRWTLRSFVTWSPSVFSGSLRRYWRIGGATRFFPLFSMWPILL